MRITLSFGEIVGWGSALIVLSSAVSIITQWVKTLLKPSKKITELENRVAEEGEEIKEMTEDNKVVLGALIALLDSAINGDNIEGLQEAKQKINKRLINR